jgi:GT2 family glycosyltransferase
MVGAVVVTHRTPELAVRCAESLRDAATVDDVVIVDTAGRAGMTQAVGGFKVLSTADNRGFGAALNRGVTEVDGEYLLLTNADVYFEAGAVDLLVAELREHPQWAVAAPLLLDPAGRVQESSFRFPGLAQSLIDLVPAPAWLRRSRFNGRYPAGWATTREFEIDHPLGACLLVRREAFTAVGGFDEDFLLYSEEIDFCRRLRAAGWKSGHIGAAAAVHVGGASTGQDRKRMLEQLYISRVKYFDAHHGRAYAAVARLLTAAGLAFSPLWSRVPRYSGLGLSMMEALRLALRILGA